jgi:hypothetical protein
MAGHNRWKDIKKKRSGKRERHIGEPGPCRRDDFDVEAWRSFFIEHLGDILRAVIHVDEVDTDEQHIRGTSAHDIPIYIWFKLADAPFAEGVELRMRWEAGTEKGWLDFRADDYLLDHTNRALANICRTLHDNSTPESNDPDS